MNIGYSRSLSIIVPLLNEEKTLAVLLAHLETADADEVILVDDGSFQPHLAEPLDNYLIQLKSLKVFTVRMPERGGLVKAR